MGTAGAFILPLLISSKHMWGSSHAQVISKTVTSSNSYKLSRQIVNYRILRANWRKKDRKERFVELLFGLISGRKKRGFERIVPSPYLAARGYLGLTL